jgi:protein phosphatase
MNPMPPERLKPSSIPHLVVGIVCSVGVGPTRGGRSRNEDNYLICREGEMRFRVADREEIRPTSGEGVLLAVADGMGGHADGELASSTAVQALARLYARGRPEAPELVLPRFILDAHRQLREMVARNGRVNLGTTLTCAWVFDELLHWAHIGDSRIYLFRDGALQRLSADQTRAEFAARDRRPEPRDGEILAQNFIYGSRGLGDDGGIRLDPGRDSGTLRLRTGDRILLCTDGLSSVVDDARIADALREVPTPVACAEILLERAVALGTTDNVTVLIGRVDAIDAVHLPTEKDPTSRISS